ncbi:serine/threonine protein kinase [Nannizzia gypsea CBS 118893]|uniref:Serine/threonine protein kinase n=1 Tax=Arthroderma gypseum (strain ATCC MYA-4604 / CBS 118893) TaxID=535722 RepID=E4UN31_ARTGP|nr:serine/threonine protein kinase [Nannizzia gypsea CBS 118893]EFR00333.1 serine/threonine protein kinase [Nannizzia gypsea CBS 118893]
MCLAYVNDDDERSAVFNTVLATVKLQHLPQLAIGIRKERDDALTSTYDCRILPQSLFGSHHILFQLEFNDGVSWLLKVPANGYPNSFDEMSALSLRSEALTMRLLKRETTVPVPEVYHFEDSCDNKLSCPFILMEYVAGLPLYEVWFNQSLTPDDLERHRLQTLRDIAQAMTQLNKYVFSQGGAIHFDQDGEPSHVRSFRKLHIGAMLDALRTNDEYDGANIFVTAGPFTCSKSYFTYMLEKRKPAADEDEYSLGLYKLLQLFIDLALADTDAQQQEKGFVLSHPDFDIQNIIVSEDGRLRGLIDWDGVVTVPRCVGNERYPSWLTRDWDPMKYAYDENATPGPDSPNNYENSPTELNHYREIYQGIMKNVLQDKPAKQITSRSLLLENLAIAADNPVSFHSIVERVFEEAKAKTAKDDDDDDTFYTYEVATAYATGKLSESHRERVLRGFQALLS